MAPRKRKRSSEPPPPRSNAVAWVALLVSLIALALALSEKSWVQTRLQTIARNWGTMVGEIESAVARGEAPDAEQPFAQAAEAARGGEQSAMADRLDEAILTVRQRAEQIGGDLSRRLRQVARDLERLRTDGAATEQTAATIDDLGARFTALLGESQPRGRESTDQPVDESTPPRE